MVKSRSKISRQPVKKSPARAAGKSARKSAAAKTATKGKWVYAFGGGRAEARATMRNLLGGKGAGLAEMASLGLSVPPGFTITTEVCTYFYEHGKTYPKDLKAQVEAALGDSLGTPARHNTGMLVYQLHQSSAPSADTTCPQSPHIVILWEYGWRWADAELGGPVSNS
jgi:Pyruvate phosphate dikinase, AMP/ATP-binding domain